MISSTVQATPRARLALARSANFVCQQARQYRYGPWQVESASACGRHRAVRYRYMDTLSSRKLAWDTNSARAASQTAMPSLAQGMPGAVHADTANIQSWSVAATKTAAAVEREAVERLLRPQQDMPQSVAELRLPLKSVRDYVQEFAPKDTSQTADAGRTTRATSQFSDYDDLHKYGPVHWSEPDSLQPNVAEVDDGELPVTFAKPIGAEFNPHDQAIIEKTAAHQSSVEEEVPVTFAKPIGAEFNAHDQAIIEKTAAHQSSIDEEVPVAFAKPIGAEYNAHDQAIIEKTAAHQASISNLEASNATGGAVDAPDGTIKAAAQRRVINLETAKKQHQNSFEAKVPKSTVSVSQPELDVEFEAMRRAEQLHDGKAEYAAEWGAKEHQVPPVAEQLEAVAEQRLSGLEDAKANYETSWDSATQDALSRAPRRGRFDSEKDDGVSSMDESFPALNNISVQQARARVSAAAHAQAQKYPYPRVPQGLEVSYSQETGERAASPHAVRDGSAAAMASDYIVLALDPETQTVHVATTSSAVESLGASPATPAEALLRLSSPAKFFPHFRPLQAQGYEIVSGRSDVLIFRKVRQAEDGAATYEPSTIGRRKRSLGRKLVVGAVAAAGAACSVGTLTEYMPTKNTA